MKQLTSVRNAIEGSEDQGCDVYLEYYIYVYYIIIIHLQYNILYYIIFHIIFKVYNIHTEPTDTTFPGCHSKFSSKHRVPRTKSPSLVRCCRRQGGRSCTFHVGFPFRNSRRQVESWVSEKWKNLGSQPFWQKTYTCGKIFHVCFF